MIKKCAAPLVALLATLSGCTTVGNVLNPFQEAPTAEALKGELNDRALSNDKSTSDNARQALEQIASYQRAQMPEPNRPVIQPAVVRLMWVPDHLNRYGDLIPAHYYYLKVLKDRMAVSDAFELEGQLNGPGGSKDTSNLPFVYQGEKK